MYLSVIPETETQTDLSVRQCRNAARRQRGWRGLVVMVVWCHRNDCYYLTMRKYKYFMSGKHQQLIVGLDPGDCVEHRATHNQIIYTLDLFFN